MEHENLNFVVTLSATVWDKKPQFSIWLDESPIIQSELSDDKSHEFRFSKSLSTGEHSLKIRLENKTDLDTTKDDQGNIAKDLLLNIEKIEIDDIDLGNLIWQSEFIPDEPREYQGQTITKLQGCVNLGWNGTYILKFTSPFYLWLLENL